MVMVIMAIINRIVQGSFSILVFIAYGFSVPGDLLVSIFPHVFRGALILSVITLAFGFRTITRGTLAMGAVMATLALVLLLGSYIIGLTATELVYPFSSARTIEFFSRYFAYPR